MRNRIRLITLMRILIFFYVDPDPTFHPDTDPDPELDPSFKKRLKALKKCSNRRILPYILA
jgi:hypothetical protein